MTTESFEIHGGSQDGRVIVGREDQTRQMVYDFRDPGETVIRVRVTEVVKKKRSKKR